VSPTRPAGQRSTLLDIRRHAATLSTILWNHGADVTGPFVDRFEARTVVVTVSAHLPGPAVPAATEVMLQEVWEPVTGGRYQRVEYAYDLIDHPWGRRRAFHAHDVRQFIAEFDVVTHEHCEEQLGAPACEHYFGLPVDAYDAVRRFTMIWGRPDPLGCADLRCMV
jgi:hypothetical protein